MSETTVINLRKRNGVKPVADVYVGRPSKWGNPFSIGRDGDRAEVIRKYAAHLQAHPELYAQIEKLRGKTLGCWCAPEPCHADVLAAIADGRLTLAVND